MVSSPQWMALHWENTSILQQTQNFLILAILSYRSFILFRVTLRLFTAIFLPLINLSLNSETYFTTLRNFSSPRHLSFNIVNGLLTTCQYTSSNGLKSVDACTLSSTARNARKASLNNPCHEKNFTNSPTVVLLCTLRSGMASRNLVDIHIIVTNTGSLCS